MARDNSTYNLFITPLMLPREDFSHDKWRLLGLNIKLKLIARRSASGKFLIDLLQASINFFLLFLLVFVFVLAEKTRERNLMTEG
jgi:hypothetical protein